MHWNSVSEFFAMGGYAFYVWGSFGLTAVVVVGEVLLLRAQRKTVLRNLRNELLAESNPTRNLVTHAPPSSLVPCSPWVLRPTLS